MKKTVMMIAGLVLPAILTGCATETVISQKPGYSSAPSWIRDVGGDENGQRYQVGSAEGDESAMASAVEKMAAREARRALAASVQSETEAFAKDEMGMSDSQAQEVAQETVKLKASGLRVTQTYWQKVADNKTEIVRLRAWAKVTMPEKEYQDAVKAAKARAKGKAVSQQTWDEAKEKWKQADAE